MSYSTFFIKSYGCQMNIYDSEKIISILENKGLKQNKDAETADLVVFNTCNIRDKAAHKLYSDIGRVNKHKKEKTIAVVGCVAQAENEWMLNNGYAVKYDGGTKKRDEKWDREL